jgi:cell pole-organizing protein PopZ
MSDANAQEPTMEEILASIRRIISEDDAPAADAAPEAAAPEPEEPEDEIAPAPPAPEPVALAAQPVEEEDILELTDPIAPRLAPRRNPGHILADPVDRRFGLWALVGRHRKARS